MKGLLLKDWYALKSYGKSNLFIMLMFSIMGGIADKPAYFAMFYSCLFVSTAGMALMSYEEKEQWNSFAATLPYTRSQIVSSKYILYLFLGVLNAMVNIVVQVISANTIVPGRLFVTFSVMMAVTLIPASILLVIIFRFGVNKGRIVYILVAGVFCGVAINVLMMCMNPDAGNESIIDGLFALPAAAGMVLLTVSAVCYALSLALSVHFYKKCEIN